MKIFRILQSRSLRGFRQVIGTLILLTALHVVFPAHAAVCGENVPTDEGSLNTYIQDCNAKLSNLSGQKQTLASAIDYLNTQIKITQAKVYSTNTQLNKLNVEIEDLTSRIESIDYSLDDLTKLFINRVRQTYMRKNTYEAQIIAHSTGLGDLLRGVEYTKKIRDNDRNILISLEKSRLDFNSQKELKEEKQQEIVVLKAKLDSENNALASQIASKNKLLSDTKNDEARYQSLLSAAQSQLSAFRRFTTTQGGATILSNQTKCDDWGCYYNQRDGEWGNRTIGLSPESMKEVGCLVTSMAMIASHYGKSIKPGDIAGSNAPFWGNTAYMNQGTWTAAGVTMTRTRLGSSRAKIDEELAAGRPVIVGIYGGPDHFLVIKAKDGDDYIMHDPFPANSSSIKFTSKYPLSAISAVDKVTVN